MTAHDRALPTKAARYIESPLRLSGLGSFLGARIVDWITTAADYYTAATVYEQLVGLSDGQLHRRGLSRETLGWDIAQARDRPVPDGGWPPCCPEGSGGPR